MLLSLLANNFFDLKSPDDSVNRSILHDLSVMRDRVVFSAAGGGWHDKHRQTTLNLDGRLCFQLE